MNYYLYLLCDNQLNTPCDTGQHYNRIWSIHISASKLITFLHGSLGQIIENLINSKSGDCTGIAKPRPTRACALQSTSQALPSPAHDQQESCDSIVEVSKCITHLAVLASLFASNIYLIYQ